MGFRIGYAQDIITPPLGRPVYLAGFARNRRATAVHDDLFVRALAVDDGQTTLVFSALDLIGCFRHDVYEVIQRVAAAGRAPSPRLSIVIACTHTHHGPDTLGLWGPDDTTSGVDSAYLADVKAQIGATLLHALEHLEPIAAVKGVDVLTEGFAKNTRDPAILDDELTCLQFLDGAQRPRATLVVFPCHPEVLAPENTALTADYPHYLCAEIAAQTGAPCLFFVGALGGMLTPAYPEDARTFASAEAMGRGLASAALAALTTAVPEAPHLRVERQVFSARLTNVLYELAFARKLLPDMRGQRGEIETEVNLIRLGPIWLATAPGEVLPKYGLQIKAALHAAGAESAGVIGLANDEVGYILPVEDFQYPENPLDPGDHYEETNSIGKEIGPQMMAALADLMAGVASEFHQGSWPPSAAA